MSMKVACKYSLNKDNTAATVTIGGNKVGSVFITGIVAGYSANPAATKRLTVAVDGTTKFAVPITVGGPAPIDWDGDWYIETDGSTGVVVTLPASGTAGVTGDLCVFTRA